MNEVAPNTPFHQLRGLGNILRHAYDNVDVRVIFDTIEYELPALKRDCLTYLAKMQDKELP